MSNDFREFCFDRDEILIALFQKLFVFFLLSSIACVGRAIEFLDRPLLTSASVEPNVMLLIDSSASMGFFARGNYVRSFDYADCPESITIPPNQLDESFVDDDVPSIRALLDSQNRVYFSYNGNEFDWGDFPGIGATGREIRCFSNRLVTNETSTLVEPSYHVTYSIDGFDTAESGNFWNFYFSNSDQSGADTFDNGVRKFGVGRRIDLAEDAANLLIRNLTGVRLGLSHFATIPNGPNSNTGAEVLESILPLDVVADNDDTHRDKILESLSEIEVQGFTPIAEAILDLGRYFIQGYEDQQIIIHPNSDSEQRITARELFSVSPRYADGVSVPTRENPVIEEFCQSNFIVALTDGEPMELALLNPLIVGGDSIGDSFRGYSDLTTLDDSLDVNTIIRRRDNNTLINEGVLDDVTLALQEIDLRPDLNNLGGASVSNGVNTYYVAGFENGLTESLELREAADNGVDGDGEIFSAINTTELIVAFDEIFGEIISSQGSFSTAAFSSGAITSDTAIFQSSFRFSGTLWSGDVQAFNLGDSTDDNVVATFEEEPVWSASQLLTQRLETLSHEDRVLYTMSSSRDGVPFTVESFNNSLFDENQESDLLGGGSDNVENVINYIRGEDNALFRDRNSGEFGRLGDIVNSSPIVVGVPNLDYPDFNSNAAIPFGSSSNGGSYSEFAEQFSDRKSMVYVGANDGMLHGFDADSGEEVFAYLPSMVFNGESTGEGLYYLTDSDYQHKFYVDGNQTATDVFIDPTGDNSPQWRTVLIGGLRTGGKGLYALDITDTSDLEDENAEDTVLWEFDGTSSGGDVGMGHIFGTPQIALLNNGRFAVITGNGYNSEDERARLFILFIEAGADGRWETNDYMVIPTNRNRGNGLSTPTLVDLDGDRIVDRVYAGDLRGNMWAFDLSSRNPRDWVRGGQRLFSASENNTDQSITTAPLVARNSDTSTNGNEPNLLVFFGTGQILEADDLGDTDTQSFYAVWDRGDNRRNRNDLHERRLIVSNDGLGRVQDTRSPFGDPIQWFNEGTDSNEYGWFIDLPSDGERIVTQARLLSEIIFFSSSIPSISPCSSGGTGFLNAVGTDGLATRTPIIDFNDDGSIDDEDQGFLSQAIMNGVPNGSAFIGSRNPTTPCDSNGYLQAYSTSDGNVSFQAVCPENTTGLGRRAWIEIFNN